MRVHVIGGVSDAEPTAADTDALRSACVDIGASLTLAGQDIVICSPFRDAADYYAVEGAARVEPGGQRRLIVHFPDSEEIRLVVNELCASCKGIDVTLRPHAPPEADHPVHVPRRCCSALL